MGNVQQMQQDNKQMQQDNKQMQQDKQVECKPVACVINDGDLDANAIKAISERIIAYIKEQQVENKTSISKKVSTDSNIIKDVSESIINCIKEKQNNKEAECKTIQYGDFDSNGIKAISDNILNSIRKK